MFREDLRGRTTFMSTMLSYLIEFCAFEECPVHLNWTLRQEREEGRWRCLLRIQQVVRRPWNRAERDATAQILSCLPVNDIKYKE